MEYNHSFYNSVDLKEYARLFLKKIPKTVDILVSTGSSGCAIASAILMLDSPDKEFKHIYVAKDEERRHAGKSINYDLLHKNKLNRAVIVDDLIDTGRTTRNLIEKITKYCETKGYRIKIYRIIVGYNSNTAENINYIKIKEVDG